MFLELFTLGPFLVIGTHSATPYPLRSAHRMLTAEPVDIGADAPRYISLRESTALRTVWDADRTPRATQELRALGSAMNPPSG